MPEHRPEFVLRAVEQALDLEMARAIFSEYAQSLGVDLCFQNFEHELLTLPGEYVPSRGSLLLAWQGADVAGCCAMRSLDGVDYPNACEMKRLYVRPGYRGCGLGRQLAQATMETARMTGYDFVLLDTLSDMETARALYHELGFKEIPPYYHNPIAGAHYLMADLRQWVE